MNFKIECKSLLLQKTLEIFLKEYLSEDGVVISDENGDIIIGKDIKKPFSKSQLLLQLEKIENSKLEVEKVPNLEIDMKIFEEESFEEKVDKLVDEFSTKLKKLIKEEYGKK